ncbi:aminopyrimidine aminohydrolase [Sphingobacterium mizutaii NBRC 14946 = DSM 11724]|uniref:Aminopyrimidine aminohydrolase n=2 Tax=Sphingobacterium mizutaii TaxID=1010 RepID=A0AAJ4XDZ6_9SPHI|nr:thiaminase II [Sphingobacterium mizutaii]GEM67642.1 aminopyrimidine aminohydrolase [Sphingobacterium mizutaii NBRC 14946 = DSM 11724]SDL15951.1 thiaminase /4-amino-5-aminomethyl-2-methylpyrimidine deaminase [Sphingobacterium mizutaii]SNV52623.1 Thiaminase-2 [Sphingobacterium mizutaii]
MNWTDQAWEAILPIYQEILKMPFIEELKNGTLPLEKFQFYMLQDAKYLEHYGRALAALGSKAADNEMALDFFEFGKNALIVERALHEAYFKQFNLEPNQEITIEPVCHHYIHFLKSTVAYDPIEVATAAILPCFWIYKEVGDHIYQNQNTENNPYKNWIETYSGEEFAEGVKKALQYSNDMAENSTEKGRKAMLEAFIAASRLEFKFWDAAYRNITW